MRHEAEEFVEFCTKLRLLGAKRVQCGEFAADFEGRVVEAAPKREPVESLKMTEEEKQAFIEAEYARELGLG